jgi:hypothetical protein
MRRFLRSPVLEMVIPLAVVARALAPAPPTSSSPG